MSSYRYPVIETVEIETTFLELAEQWRRETGMLSVISKISMHPAYQRIIGIGQPVVPLIMRELEREPDHWFWALSAITGANPVKPEQRGKLEQMAQAWIEWEEQMGTDGRLESYKENKFPNLSGTDYCVTSKQNTLYNCFAWAAGEDDRWWSPIDPDNMYYWVEGVTAELTMSAFIQAYKSLGYEICDNSELEAGFEKIAIYATSDGEPTHAARQLSNGKWTSKLGRWEDVEHELEGLTGDMYGSVQQILKRATDGRDARSTSH